jgi:AcrR family transcriptional regulator
VTVVGGGTARPPLHRAGIVAAGVELADTEGLGSLSMRNLARRLGYEVMSLYNHVASKDELLALMVDAVAAEIAAPSPTDAPLVAIRGQAIATRQALARHPWAADQWLRRIPGPVRCGLMDDLLRLFHDSGLTPAIAHHGYHAVSNHVVGYTLQELSMAFEPQQADTMARDFVASIDTERYPFLVAHVHEHLEGHTSSSFELVLDLILDGLVRLDRAERRRRPSRP